MLEDVHQILCGVMNALHIDIGQSLANANNNEELSNEKALTNMFAILDIEESIDQEETATAPAQGPSSSPTTTTTVTYMLEEEEVNEEEIYFSIYCFFKDF